MALIHGTDKNFIESFFSDHDFTAETIYPHTLIDIAVKKDQ